MSDTPQYYRIQDLSKIQQSAVWMFLGLALFMVWDQFYWWGEREDYSFGYLVPFFVGYVLYDRWPVISSYLIRGAGPTDTVVDSPAEGSRVLDYLATIVFTGSILLFGVGGLLRAVSGPQNPASLAIAAGFAGALISTVFIFSTHRADGQSVAMKQRLELTFVFLFPALIWLVSAPLVSSAEKQVLQFLQSKVTFIVFNSLDLLGYEISREGSVLKLPSGHVGVEEACSGIRSLTACIFAGSFLAAVFLNRLWKKVLLVAFAMAFAVLTNLMRGMFLTLWAYENGAESIEEHWVLPLFGDIGSVHDVTGFAILGVTCVGLMCLLPIFNFKLKDFDDVDDAEGSPLDSDDSLARGS